MLMPAEERPVVMYDHVMSEKDIDEFLKPYRPELYRLALEMLGLRNDVARREEDLSLPVDGYSA